MLSVLRIAVVVGLAAGCREYDGGRLKPLAIGSPAPVFDVRTLAGDSARVAPGAPLTLVNLWATWCIPCREEFGDLSRLHAEYARRGFRILAVSVDQGGDGDVRSFAQEHHVAFTIGRDPDGDIQRAFLAVGLPMSYLIGKDGRLLWKSIGALPPGAGPLRAIIDSALAADSSTRR